MPSKATTLIADDLMTEWRHLVNSPEIRLSIYKYIRSLKVYRGVTALCAATQSEYLKRAGYIRVHYAWTADLASILLSIGWRKIALATDLRPMDMCYSQDRKPKNGSPDHVYLFLCWLDKAKRVALILDNYSPHPHPRNLGKSVWYKGKLYGKTPFDYALRAKGGS